MKTTNQRELHPLYHQINVAEAKTDHAPVILDVPNHVQVDQPRQTLLRLPEVMKRTSMGRTSIYQMIKFDTFPRPVKVGSASLWIDSEISTWIEHLMAAHAKEVQ